MQSTTKRYACRAIGAGAALAAGLFVPVAVARAAMPVTEQNALVGKYCAVCHTDAKPLGGLSLEKFDAAHLDPSLAAMIVSKLKARAMGASGVPLPDQTTQDALLNALSAGAVDAGRWTVIRTQDPATQAAILTASVARASSARNAGEPEMYRLKLTCDANTHDGAMQLTWAPADISQTSVAMSVAVDGKAPFTFEIEKGNAAAVLYATRPSSGAGQSGMLFPAQTLTIGNLFPDDTIVFPFGGLSETDRQTLSKCFTRATGESSISR